MQTHSAFLVVALNKTEFQINPFTYDKNRSSTFHRTSDPAQLRQQIQRGYEFIGKSEHKKTKIE